MAPPWRAALRSLADLFFPPLCLLCEAPLASERGLCPSEAFPLPKSPSTVEVCRTCRATLRPIRPPLCRRCGAPGSGAGADCRLCRGWVHLQGARAPFLLAGAARAFVHALKYGGLTGLVPFAGPGLEQALRAAPAAWGAPAALVPVPLHPARRRERGFNQSELLAAELGARAGLPTLPVLERARPTRPQIVLAAGARAANVAGAFRAHANLAAFCRGRRFVLVDDVLTTGSTLEACAGALRAAGAEAAFAIAFARALPEEGARRAGPG